MQKNLSEKSFLQFLKKLLYHPNNQPTNHQPIITNNTDLIGTRWRRSKKNTDDFETFENNHFIFSDSSNNTAFNNQ